MKQFISRLAGLAAIAAAATVLRAQNAAVTITVDVAANRHAINPAVYVTIRVR